MKINIKKIVYLVLFFATGIVLPLISGQIKEKWDSLHLMYIVVLSCGGLIVEIENRCYSRWYIGYGNKISLRQGDKF